MGFTSDKQRRFVMSHIKGRIGIQVSSKDRALLENLKEKPQISNYEETLLAVMEARKVPKSTKQLAKDANMEWQTADKYLNKLEKSGFIKSIKTTGKTMWQIKE